MTRFKNLYSEIFSARNSREFLNCKLSRFFPDFSSRFGRFWHGQNRKFKTTRFSGTRWPDFRKKTGIPNLVIWSSSHLVHGPRGKSFLNWYLSTTLMKSTNSHFRNYAWIANIKIILRIFSLKWYGKKITLTAVIVIGCPKIPWCCDWSICLLFLDHFAGKFNPFLFFCKVGVLQ